MPGASAYHTPLGYRNRITLALSAILSHMRSIALPLLLIFSFSCSADPRQVFGADSPAWLQAVGKLTVPSYRYINGDRHHHDQHCTATLVKEDIILSGWHCLEYYADLSQEIVFSLPYAKTTIKRSAIHLADGGGMHADWLLLKLNRPINEQVAAAVPVSTVAVVAPGTQALTLAGYSRDSGLGGGGRKLSYHPGCEILHNESYRVATNCVAFKGSSGGPVVHRQTIVGVISAGDSEQLSYYTPSNAFIGAVRLYLH